MAVAKEFIGPQGNNNFSRLVSTNASGPMKTIWLAGMVAPVGSKELESGTLREQAAVAMDQVVSALAKCGAKIDDVVRWAVFIKDIDQEKIIDVSKSVFKHIRHLGENAGNPYRHAASTYIGVQALAHPKMLVEIEATAQVPAPSDAKPGVVKEYMQPQNGRYCQIVTSVAQGPSTTLWIAGQTGTPETLDKPIKDQAAAAMKGMKRVLAEKGATLKDVVRFNTYIPFLDDTKVQGYREAFGEAMADLPADERPANTLLGVTGLVDPKMMLECEAIAVIPAPNTAPGNAITKEFLGPQEKMNFSEAVATTNASGQHFKTLWLAGSTGNAAGESTQDQVDKALTQIDEAIKQAGGKGFEDVVNIQTYLFEPRKQENIIGFARALNKHTKHLPRDKRAANTLVGTTGLAGGCGL